MKPKINIEEYYYITQVRSYGSLVKKFRRIYGRKIRRARDGYRKRKRRGLKHE